MFRYWEDYIKAMALPLLSFKFVTIEIDFLTDKF